MEKQINYCPPSISVTEVEIEQGFALSTEDYVENTGEWDNESI